MIERTTPGPRPWRPTATSCRSRLSTPDEQSAVIAFLASDKAYYVCGVALDVNGGLFMA